MELNLKEWRNQQQEQLHESELKHETEKQDLVIEMQQNHQTQQQHDSVLPLFVVTELQQTSNKLNRMASYFSMAQWQELELQALIYRYMLAGADVPAELLYPIKKSLFNSSQFYLHHYPHYQPTMMQPGYWGRGGMDPEPGRCRRTDGKKWRCSRDVVAAHKYCERHMHRGRNRSRKPVEIPTPIASSIGNVSASRRGSCGDSINRSIATINGSPLCSDDKEYGLGHFLLSGTSSSVDLQRSSGSMTHNKSTFAPENNDKHPSANGASDGRVLRCFFDDWPRSLQDCENVTSSNVRAAPSAADISLKLSTGDDSDNRERSQLNWALSWGAPPLEVSQMGGPLAEAFRSSVSNATTSPNSVLHELQRRGTVSEATSYVST